MSWLLKQSIRGEPAEFESGYVTELLHMMSRRLEMVTEQTAREYIRSQHKVVPLRMLLEAKKDGRRKARLILQGFREPTEWDLDSNISPVCCPSVIRSLLFMSGRAGDVISSIDVSVAFLQSELYAPLIRVFHNSPTTHHNPPQLTTTVVGELWVSCGELWWACHNSPQNGQLVVAGYIVATTSRHNSPTTPTTTCDNLPQHTTIQPHLTTVLPHFPFHNFNAIRLISFDYYN